MSNTKVSIIMPSLNVAEYIRECIESVVNQTLKNIEIICVDAGSTDGTLEILQEYALKDNRITIINSEIKSYGYQMNIGIKSAKGEYIGIVETDDFVDTKMYEELYDYASKLDADVVKCPFYEYRNKRQANICYFSDFFAKIFPEKCFSVKEHGEILSYHASVWAGIYRRQYLYKNNIMFIEAPGAGYVDVGFRYESLIKTKKISWYKKPLYYYRINNNNSSTNCFKHDIMVKRWIELIERERRDNEEFSEYYLPFMLLDLYTNTLAYLNKIRANDELYLELVKLFSLIDKEVINASPVLPNFIKKRMIDFIDKPKEYFNAAQRIARKTEPFYKIANYIFPKGSKEREFIKEKLFRTKKET